VLAAFPEIDLARNRVGIHGKLATLATPLCDADRVEILRPLQADPKEARRQRAARRRRD
jgi:putative ubiquitin-RnfH superfamily antitoxin RatB of RatAB toxin-antitoxin module